ncbi:MAG: protein kinase, partial [bacterium]
MKKIKHYEIVDLLGTGGMGEVYKAIDPLLEREVAIKVMHRHLCDDEKIGKRFLHEARAAAGLVHPNIVAIYETGKAKRGWFIVMEYIKGEPLTHHLSKKATQNPGLALKLIRQILGALSFAHAKGTLHRDIKADNVMVTENDVAKILDFGIAKILTKKGLTVAGDILGTVEYMAPEQMLGEPIDHRCDLYAVGILLYQILTKRLPFEDKNPVAILYKKLNEDPVPPSYYNHSVGFELDQVVLKAITKDQKDRWASAEAFSEALNSIVQNAAESVKPRNNQASKLTEFFINVDRKARSQDIQKFQSAFVGRTKEMQRLAGFIDQVRNGRGQTVILRGEAGVGKSTLANQLANSLEFDKVWALYGVCLYQKGLNAYLPFMDAVRGFFSKARGTLSAKKLSELTKSILERVPLLYELTQITTTDSGAKIVTTAAKENSESENLFDAWCQLIRLFSASQPVVLIIDDLQLADEASLRLFHYLAHHITDKRLLLLGITRADRFDLHKDGKPTVVSDMLSRISRESNCEKITLYRLGKESCEALIDKTLSPALFTEDFYDHVYEGTKGNPLFVLETLKLLL